jgi:hypothetical protein
VFACSIHLARYSNGQNVTPTSLSQTHLSVVIIIAFSYSPGTTKFGNSLASLSWSQFVSDLWWTKQRRNKYFFEYLGFPCLINKQRHFNNHFKAIKTYQLTALLNKRVKRSLHLSRFQKGKTAPLYSALEKSLRTLQNVLEVMSTSVYTGLNPFNFTCKHFRQICLCDVSYERNYCSF